MIKINIDNIDEYYELVNKHIDEYFNHNIDPKALKRYLKRDSIGIDKFIKKSNLEEVQNIEKVIEDVINDRIAVKEMEILTFENFSTDKFNIRFDIKDEILHIISDLYKVSLGHLKIDRNNIKLTGIGKDKEIYIFNREHLDIIYNQICDKLFEKISKESLSLDILDINIPLKNKIDKDYFKANIFEQIKEDFTIIEKILSYTTGDFHTLIDVPGYDIKIFEKKT